MPRKVGVVNLEVRFCSECPYLRSMCTSQPMVGNKAMLTTPTLVGQVPGPTPNKDVGWFWWMCGRLGEQVNDLKERLGGCPLVEINQPQKELKKNAGDPKNHSPHQKSKGPSDAL